MNSWSYSHYSLALQCLRKFKYVVIDKLEPEGLESSDLGFGTALHAGLNDILTGKDGEVTFGIMWDAMDGTLQYGRYKHPELKELGLNFLSKFRRLHAKKYKIEQAEKRLFADYRGVKLEGTPDFIGYFEGRPSLRDFKTSGTNYAKEKAPSSVQLHLYAYLTQRETGFVPATLGYDVFNKGLGSIQILTWEYSEKLMYTHLDNMIDYLEMMDKQTTYPKNMNNCMGYNKVCEYFSLCFPKEEG
jgi:hypothetical protein